MISSKHFNTKYIVLLIVLTIPFALEANAQSVKIGVRSGLNFSTFKGDVDVLTQNVEFPRLRRRTSYHAGGFAYIELNEWVALQPEILYIQKGSVLEGSQLGSVEITGTYRFSYLQMPLLLSLRFPVKNRFSAVLLAGPSFEVSTASGVEVDLIEEVTLRSFEDVITSTNMTGIIGVGAHLELNDSNTLSFDVRYNPGFSDIAAEEDVQLRTDTIIMSLGYSFSL